jgi:Putative esterase
MRMTRRTALMSLGGAIGVLGLGAGGAALVDTGLLPGKSALDDALGRCDAPRPPARLRTDRVAVAGWSMGGYGALLCGLTHRDRCRGSVRAGRTDPPGPATGPQGRADRDRMPRQPVLDIRRARAGPGHQRRTGDVSTPPVAPALTSGGAAK